MDTMSEIQETLVTLTADIVAAHVSNNSVAVSDLPVLILSMHDEAPQHSWKLLAWIGVAAIIALLFGEAMMGSRR